jgi:hypothetical protein
MFQCIFYNNSFLLNITFVNVFSTIFITCSVLHVSMYFLQYFLSAQHCTCQCIFNNNSYLLSIAHVNAFSTIILTCSILHVSMQLQQYFYLLNIACVKVFSTIFLTCSVLHVVSMHFPQYLLSAQYQVHVSMYFLQ